MLIAETIVQAIHYILSRVGTSNKLKIVKLLFLADKYHLQLFGRTITGDNFIAMKAGPVGSTAKDILDFNLDWLEQKDIDYAEKYIKRSGDFDYDSKKVPCKYEMLSETDKKALDFILKKFGKMDHTRLIKLTHRFPEWAQFEKELTKGISRSKPIKTDELFSHITRDPFSIHPALIKEAEAIYNGIAR